MSLCNIMLRYPCNVEPLTSPFYIVKLGFIGAHNLFLIFALNVNNVYPQSMI